MATPLRAAHFAAQNQDGAATKRATDLPISSARESRPVVGALVDDLRPPTDAIAFGRSAKISVCTTTRRLLGDRLPLPEWWLVCGEPKLPGDIGPSLAELVGVSPPDTTTVRAPSGAP